MKVAASYQMKVPGSDRFGSILIREDREDIVPPGTDPDEHAKALHAACRRSVEEQVAITRKVHPTPDPLPGMKKETTWGVRRGPPGPATATRAPSDKQVAWLHKEQDKAGKPHTLPDTVEDWKKAMYDLTGKVL